MRRFMPVLGAALVVVAACQDTPNPTAPDGPGLQASGGQLPHQAQERARWFGAAAPEVLALPQTVFADDDQATGQLVFGIEHPGVARGVQNVMARLGIPASAYRLQVTEPIRFMSTTLRTEHRPTKGGIQIHFGQYVCTLGFNVDHGGGRSFITNSHCTNRQGTTGTTAYYQPLSSVNSTAIAREADDPAYGGLPGCSPGKKCRYSDASRALYQSGTTSDRGVIAKTTGENNGSLNVAGTFSVTEQSNSVTTFSGTMHKVGRTTGWTSGNVTSTCATVNVSGSNIQLLCQTLVQNPNAVIVQGGDSGSPIFQRLSGDNVRLAGILWGGNSSGSLFVFSPLKNIQDELGGVTATTSGTGGGDDGGGEDPPPCTPRGNSGQCK